MSCQESHYVLLSEADDVVCEHVKVKDALLGRVRLLGCPLIISMFAIMV